MMKKLTGNKELIYLLDDDQVFSYALELWLELQGYRIKVFHNTYAFLNGLKLRKPDVVILDFALNDNYQGIENGAHVAARINKQFDDVPVVMLSEQQDLQVAVDLFSKSIVDYVVKDDAFHENLSKILIQLKEMRILRQEIKDLKVLSKTKLKRLFIVVGSALLFWLLYAAFV